MQLRLELHAWIFALQFVVRSVQEARLLIDFLISSIPLNQLNAIKIMQNELLSGIVDRCNPI